MHSTSAAAPVKIAVLAVATHRNGGTLPYSQSMIDALSRLPAERYSVTIYTGSDNDDYDHYNLPVERIKRPGWLILEHLFGGDRFASADCIIAPVYSLSLLATGRPFIFTLHDLQEKYFPEYFGLATRVWRQVVNRLMTARATRIVCESAFVKGDIVKHFDVPEARVAVIPAPPISSLGGTAPDSGDGGLLALPPRVTGDYIFYPAQFWRHKNHVRLVEAFGSIAAAFPQCSLVLTGQERFEYQNVMDRVQSLGLGARVIHVGHVDRPALAALYRNATVVAVPTLFESISLPIYEAFSLGAPVCASDVVALPEQVGDAGLLFDPLSVADIAAKLSKLLASPSLRRELVARGRARMASVTHDDYARSLRSVIDAAVQTCGSTVALEQPRQHA